MKDKRTLVANGACFGYYDEDFSECEKCKIKEACHRATDSSLCEEVRKEPKRSDTDVMEAVWKFESEEEENA